MKSKDTDKEISGESLETTQLLQVSTVSGSTNNEYATTTITIVPMASLSRYDETWDGSYGVKAYSTLYWSTTNLNGSAFSRLTSSSGGWSVSDSSIGLSDRYVNQQAQGVGQTGPVSNSFPFWPSSNTFSHAVSFDWINSGATYSFGNYTQILLTRGGSQWYLVHNNNFYA